MNHRDLLRGLGVGFRVGAFNYEYARERVTDLRTARVEVGPLGGLRRDECVADRAFNLFSSRLIAEKSGGRRTEPDLFAAFDERSLFPSIAADGDAIARR